MSAAASPRFALNHMAAPRLGLADFFRLAASLEISEVEIRNDLPGEATLDGTRPEAVRDAASEAGVSIISINALQQFNRWTREREEQAIGLAAYARAAGARALVLVPATDGTGCAKGERRANLRRALELLEPILADQDTLGLVEPLGFPTSSLRSKREAAEGIDACDGWEQFRLVHDTFHHALAGEPDMYPPRTGLVHVSGVTDSTVSFAGMADGHRVLVDAGDRLDNVEQIRALLAGGYAGPLSFEPFATEVARLPDPRPALAGSMEFIRTRLASREGEPA